MLKSLLFFGLIIAFCMPVTAWSKDLKAKTPPEVYFYWGDNALLTVKVHQDCVLGGYDGFQLTPVFAGLMQNIIRKRGVTVSEVSEMTDWRDFWIKVNKSAVNPRLFVKVYGDGMLHISGSFMHKNGPDLRFSRGHGAASIVPYIKMDVAPRYDSPDAFTRDLEAKITPQANERIDRIVRDLQTQEAAFGDSLEGKNAQ